MKKVVIILVPVLALAGGAYFFLLGGKSEKKSKSTATTTQPPGEVLSLDPVTLNLADGRYLKVGIALQLSAAASAEEMKAEGPKALDTAIELLGHKTYDELIKPDVRGTVKEEISHKVSEQFEGKVLKIYFTQFVMQ